MRVLTLSTLFPDATRPSFGVFVERQTRALAERPGVEVRVVAPIGLPLLYGARGRWAGFSGVPAREVWGGLEVSRPRFPTVPAIGGRMMPALLARTLLPQLRALRRQWRFDVIDAEFFYPDGPAAVRLGRALGVPVSIKARGADIHHWGRVAGPQIVAAGQAAGGLLAVSAALRRDMAALGLPEQRVRVHHTGVELDRFRPVADREVAKQAWGVTGPMLACVGHLIPRKGQTIALEALALLPGVTLMLAGEGPDRAALEAQAAALGIAARVRFLGSLPHARLPDLLAAADAMVLPAASEGLANAWVEAIACGTPVVTCDVGGAREIVDRPEAGRLVAREAEAFAAGVREVLAAAYVPDVVREAALPFTWEANAAALEAHLRGVIAAASR
ncbi:glycosyltransferase [Sphingomonas jatrophae]|uniref:Glycosyltransferase involved in cell wall bisynthesis n=1 Tax=Sphingomonas jatrophae TaxID=1166337 RepID=A0A1I6M919_9SPHN|nr:glycosyltransferase [Sphingomonas jatrophae]SFS12189.1 Glycosyltransferase involved in cell wall bisynthesis [Sphingomonas jatrophae]